MPLPMPLDEPIPVLPRTTFAPSLWARPGRFARVGQWVRGVARTTSRISCRCDRTCRRRRGRRLLPGLVFCLGLAAFAVSGAAAESLFTNRTALIDVHGGSSLDGTVFSLGTGSALRDTKPPLDLRPFYTSWGQNVSATWMTELRPDFGFYWGFQTGDHGDKFTIRPAVNLGFIMVDTLSEQSTLSFTATGILGGWLQEKPCRGVFALEPDKGLQPFACHLGSSALPPADTLKYLVNVPPPDWLVLGVRLTFRF